MPRQARKLSSTGIYHVMLRGINQQQIFEDDEDYDKFLQILKECKEVSEYRLLAYCLMGNHVHLLIKQEQERLDSSDYEGGFKSVSANIGLITGSYAVSDCCRAYTLGASRTIGALASWKFKASASYTYSTMIYCSAK